MEIPRTISEYIKTQEAAFDLDIYPIEGWAWSMKKHIRLTTLYKNSQTSTKNDGFTPVKNIMRPLLMLQYFSEGFDVKDILLYIDDPEEYYKSLLVRKFHERWARQYGIDTVIDEMVESYVDFGGALLKDVNGVKPEVVPLQSLAFCDQTDILSGPIGIKHYYSPDQLKNMEQYGWGNRKNGATISIDELLVLAEDYKGVNQSQSQQSRTPGKYVEVYEVHGQFPKSFLTDRVEDADVYTGQLHIVAFYSGNSGQGNYETLFKGAEKTLPFKFIKRDPVFGRALGFGGAEELFEAQVWTTYDMKRLQDMLDAASKTILGAIGNNSATISNRSKMNDLDNNEIIDLGDGDLKQIDTFPRNAKLFERSTTEWEDHAQMISGTPNPLLGQEPSAGTPFKLQELITQTGKGPHEYRKGKLALFWGEVETDWILPKLAKDITGGSKFLADLDLDELQFVAQSLVICQSNKLKINYVLSNGGMPPPPDLIQEIEQKTRDEFTKRGTKHFIEILKGEMKDLPLEIKVNIVGKQKDLAQKVDKLTNVFRTVLANPYILKAPPIQKLFNQIIEASGLEQIDLSTLDIPPMPTRRMTETVDYKDLAVPPNDAQKQMLELAGIQADQQFAPQGATPSPIAISTNNQPAYT